VEPGSVRYDDLDLQISDLGQRCSISGISPLVAVVYMPASHSCPSMAVTPPGMSLKPEPPALGASLTDHVPALSRRTRASLLSVAGFS
jgi:hypothetical protein